MNSLHGNMSPLGARAKKQRPPPQGEMSHISRRAAGATMASRMLAKLPTISFRPVFWYSAWRAIQRLEEVLGRRRVVGLHAPRAGQRAAEDVHQAGRHFVRVEEIDELGQVPQVLAGDGADHAPARIALEPVHGLDAPAGRRPGLPSCFRVRSAIGARGRVQRNADADLVPAEELDGRIVQQRGVGLDAEAEVVARIARCRRRRPRGSAAARPRGR